MVLAAWNYWHLFAFVASTATPYVANITTFANHFHGILILHIKTIGVIQKIRNEGGEWGYANFVMLYGKYEGGGSINGALRSKDEKDKSALKFILDPRSQQAGTYTFGAVIVNV